MMQVKQLPSWKPRSYQADAVKLGVSQACAGFLLRPGMGKTSIIYAMVQILKSKKLMKRALVIVPIKPMYRVWPNQKNDWAEFADLKVNICHGKDRLAMLMDDEADICCINPEGLEWLCDSGDIEIYVRKHFDILVVDESTKFKNSQSQRFKRLRKFVKFFKRRYILTGSFAPQGLLDLFAQIYILDEGASLGSYITHYRSKYFYPTDPLGYNLATYDWAAAEIARKISPLTLVLEREGNIAMPELLPPNDVYVDLPPAARAKYTMMEDAMLVALENEFVVAANAAVASSKCRQIANGILFKEDGTWEDIHDAKIDALVDLIDQLNGEPALVVYEFRPDFEKIMKAIPTARRLTTGNAARDDLAISAFSAGMSAVGVGQFSSISLGIDGLQNSCSNIIMYGLTWNLQDYSQTIDRVWRPGQKSSVVSLHRIIAADTVDQRVLRVLDTKEATQTQFLGLLKDMRKP